MIEFNGADIVVREGAHSDEVRRALGEVLGVPMERVALIDDLAGYPERPAADVVCVRTPLVGEFDCLLSVQTDRLMLPYGSRQDFMQRLCELLNRQFLVPDEDDADPYIMWLFSPHVLARNVALEPVALDEDRYVIVHDDDRQDTET